MEKNNEIETAKRPVVIVDEDAIVADLERAGIRLRRESNLGIMDAENKFPTRISPSIVPAFARYLRAVGYIERPTRTEDEVIRFEASLDDPYREPIVVYKSGERSSRSFRTPHSIGGRTAREFARFADIRRRNNLRNQIRK